MKTVRLNPRHWTIKSHTAGGVTVTHTPTKISAELADEFLAMRRNGLPLVIEVEAPPTPKPVKTVEKSASDKEEKELSTRKPRADK